MEYEIEEINGDNWRPGMPKHGWRVLYGLDPNHGWTRQATFATIEEAGDFVRAKNELEQFEAHKIEREFCFLCNVYRYRNGTYDCTNGGESSKFGQLYVFTHRMSRNAALLYIKEKGLNPAQCVQIENRKPCGEDYFDAIPLAPGRRDKWHMFGGNFIFSSDGRFSEVTGSRYPLPIHDRIEEPNNPD